MPWLICDFVGSSSTPQADNEETGTWRQADEKTVNLPFNMVIEDIVLTKEANEDHQYQLYVNGRAQENFIPSGILNPNTEGRLRWADQGLAIGAGSGIQMRAAQKSGAAAEATAVLIKYAEVSG